jgi:hypothetical protein
MIDFGSPSKMSLEDEILFRGTTVLCVVSACYVVYEYSKEGAYRSPFSQLYEFELYGFSELTQSYHLPLTELLTNQENHEIQRYIDEWASDEAARAVERNN